jgi:hypothetical protein
MLNTINTAIKPKNKAKRQKYGYGQKNEKTDTNMIGYEYDTNTNTKKYEYEYVFSNTRDTIGTIEGHHRDTIGKSCLKIRFGRREKA